MTPTADGMLRLTEILGVDDWLVFAADSTGRTVYTIVEMSGDWIDAPNRGEADFGTPAWAEDWRYIIDRVRNTIPDHHWCVPSEGVDAARLQRFGMTELTIEPPVPVSAWDE